jgi:prepilin-type N-terminal cleavage/methylation domain-containing protein
MNMREKSTCDAARSDRDAFTFVELLAVLAIMGMVAVVVFPVLAGTKPNSKFFLA